MFESEETSAGSDDENEEKSTTESNESEANEEEEEEEDDESNSGGIPNLNIKGPGKVNVKNSKGVKIGNTIKMTLKVDKMIVQNETTDTAAIAGFMVNRLTEVLQGNAAIEQFIPGGIPTLLDVPSPRSNCIPSLEDAVAATTESRQDCGQTGECSSSQRQDVFVQSAMVEPVRSNLLSHSPELRVEEHQTNPCNSALNNFDNWWNLLLNNEKLQHELEQNVSLELNCDNNRLADDVSVDSIIEEFVENLNNYLIAAHEHIETPKFKKKINRDFLRRLNWEIRSGTGKLTGFQPLVRDKKIDIEVMDNLIFLTIPVHLENLKVTFEEFSVGWGDLSFSGVTTVNIFETLVSLTITSAPNTNGFLENDVSIDVSYEEVKVELEGNVAEHAMLALAKSQVKDIMRDEYLDQVICLLKQVFTDCVNGVLQYNDFCGKLASLYDIG